MANLYSSSNSRARISISACRFCGVRRALETASLFKKDLLIGREGKVPGCCAGLSEVDQRLPAWSLWSGEGSACLRREDALLTDPLTVLLRSSFFEIFNHAFKVDIALPAQSPDPGCAFPRQFCVICRALRLNAVQTWYLEIPSCVQPIDDLVDLLACVLRGLLHLYGSIGQHMGEARELRAVEETSTAFSQSSVLVDGLPSALPDRLNCWERQRPRVLRCASDSKRTPANARTPNPS